MANVAPREQVGRHGSRRLLAWLLSAVVVIVLAGCGSPTRADFAREYRQALPQLDSLRASIAAALSDAATLSNPQLASEFSRLARDASATLAKLDRLTAPNSLAPALTAIESGLARGRAALSSLSRSASTGDTRTALAASSTASAENIALANATAALTAKLGQAP